jgi:hypothetical protein
MASATLEMFIKIVGANKVAKALDNISNELDEQRKQVEQNEKANAKFAAGMSGLSKAAIAGAAVFAGKKLVDFSVDAVQAASAALEASAAFGQTFKQAAEGLNNELEKSANLFGLTNSEARQLTAVFGSVAQGIGFTEEEAAALTLRVFKLSGDIASFNNLQQGALPVINAFRSGIAGEREALATYGLKITETMVQQKAFNMTGKESVDQLTLQDKALATIAIAYDQAGVQLGNAEREADGFAASTVRLSAEIRQLKEDIGTELVPAASEVLPIFREFAFEIAPKLIEGFGGFAKTIVDFSLASQRLDLNFFQTLLQFGNIQKLADEQRILNTTTRLLAEGFDFSNNAEKEAALQTRLLRQQMTLIIPTNKKFGNSLNKDVLPFAEKLANLLGITNEQIKTQKDLQQDRDDAQKDLNRALEEEGLITAKEALRKKELQQKIAELTFFQGQGKDVTEELAVAQEELRLIELDLGRESDQLVEARKRAAEAQLELDEATGNGTSAMQTQLESAKTLQDFLDLFETDNFQEQMKEAADVLNITWADAINNALTEYYKLREQVTGKTLVEEINAQMAAFPEAFVGLPVGPPAEVPSLPVTDFSTTLGNGNGGGRISGQIDLNLTDAVGEVIQKEVIKIQERGNTLIVQ